MKAGSSARKGRGFRQEVACEVARGFGWTVEALGPRAVGKVVNTVRTWGAAGPDVVPLLARAMAGKGGVATVGAVRPRANLYDRVGKGLAWRRTDAPCARTPL